MATMMLSLLTHAAEATTVTTVRIMPEQNAMTPERIVKLVWMVN